MRFAMITGILALAAMAAALAQSGGTAQLPVRAATPAIGNTVTLKVPVEVRNLPFDAQDVNVSCVVRASDRHWNGASPVPVDGGNFDGTVTVQLILDQRLLASARYHCALLSGKSSIETLGLRPGARVDRAFPKVVVVGGKLRRR